MEAVRKTLTTSDRGIKHIYDKVRKTLSMVADVPQVVPIDSVMISNQRINAVMIAVRAEHPTGLVGFGDTVGVNENAGYVSAKYRNRNKENSMSETFIPNVNLKYFLAKTERNYGIKTNPVYTVGNTDFSYMIIPIGDAILGAGEEIELSFNLLQVVSGSTQQVVVSVSLLELGESSINEYLFKIDKSNSKQVQVANCYDIDIEVATTYRTAGQKFNDTVTITKQNSKDDYYIDSARIVGLADDRVESSLVSPEIINIVKFATPTNCSIDVNIESATNGFVGIYTSSLLAIPETVEEK